jgi:hypothetical protein
MQHHSHILSPAGLTRGSIFFAKSFFAKRMDCRVKPGNHAPNDGFNGGTLPRHRAGAHDIRKAGAIEREPLQRGNERAVAHRAGGERGKRRVD